MIKLPIVPRTFINQEDADPPICRECFEASEEMLVCKGACQQFLCTRCAITNGSRQCPNRCSRLAYLQHAPDNKIEFICPYDRNICKQKFVSVQNFWAHCESCSLQTKEEKQELEYKRMYRCRKGHKLYFITSPNFDQIYTEGDHYYTTNAEICSFCREKLLSKSVCLQCGLGSTKEVYCISCRPIPCEKKNCPIGHELEMNDSFSESLICDFCGLIARISGKFAYSDRECNFDICMKCHQKVPEKHNLLPLENEIPENLDISKKNQYIQSEEEEEKRQSKMSSDEQNEIEEKLREDEEYQSPEEQKQQSEQLE